MADELSKRNWFKRHKILTVIGILVIIAIAASAGSSKTNVTTTTSDASTSKPSSSSSKPTVAHVGGTINIGGSKGLAVTLQQVIDPASGADEFTTADAGKRFVGVKLEIQNNGKASYQDDANDNTTLIGSDNQSYTADFDDIAGCTNFNDGQYTLAAGDNTVGCVVFQLPNSVNPTKVQFQTTEGLNSSTGQWLVP